MAELRLVGRLVRSMAESMQREVGFIPEDKLDWKPTPTSKSAAEVIGEAVGVMGMCMPLFEGRTFEFGAFPKPASIEEARKMVAEAAEAYAGALESAGPELETTIETPFGRFWGPYAVTFGLIDLIHHHGQVTYIQSLLGDAENHGDPAAGQRWFGKDE